MYVCIHSYIHTYIQCHTYVIHTYTHTYIHTRQLSGHLVFYVVLCCVCLFLHILILAFCMCLNVFICLRYACDHALNEGQLNFLLYGHFTGIPWSADYLSIIEG